MAVKAPARSGPTKVNPKPKTGIFLVDFYRSAIGKKYVMALSGIALMGYVLAHMIGNLKVYLGEEDLNHYGEWLRTLGEPALPHTVGLWILRILLLGAFLAHVHVAFALTIENRRARPSGYKSRRDYIALDYASRTMRWSGIIILLFVAFHLADLTWGVEAVNPEFVRGEVYDNLVFSLSRPGVAALYVVANLALGLHLYHGAWSLFQSLGISNPKFNSWRRGFAYAFTAIVVGGNLSFPAAVQLGIVG